jgi:predicted phosphodiesterase
VAAPVRAVFYDIHGNLPALEAVLADAHAAGAKHFVLGGDYTLFGAYPHETATRLRELDAVWIRGNGERWTARPGEAPDTAGIQRAIEHCRGELGEALVGEMEALEETTTLEDVFFCHASPRSDIETFMPEPSDEDAQLLQGMGEPVFVFGHSHLQFRREASGRLLVNPGSVGMPFDGDRRAAYALWRGGPGPEQELELELRRVDYDADAYAGALRERLTPALGDAVEALVARIERAEFVS